MNAFEEQRYRILGQAARDQEQVELGAKIGDEITALRTDNEQLKAALANARRAAKRAGRFIALAIVPFVIILRAAFWPILAVRRVRARHVRYVRR